MDVIVWTDEYAMILDSLQRVARPLESMDEKEMG
jgi:hypothetical protein